MLALIFIISCKCKDDSKPSSKAVFKQSDFPVAVGNYWEYSITNEQNGNVDTLLIEVISEVDSASTHKYICSLSLSGVVVDSSFIMVNSDSLLYKAFNSEATFFADFKLKFPFAEGDVWNGITILDSITVVAEINKAIINGTTYSPVYELNRDLANFGYNLNQTFKVTPGVGIINQHIDEFTGSSFEKINFNLIDYHLN